MSAKAEESKKSMDIEPQEQSDVSSLSLDNLTKPSIKRIRGGKQITKCPHSEKKHYAKVNYKLTIFKYDIY